MVKKSEETKFVGLRFSETEYQGILDICPRGQTVPMYLKGVILQLIVLKQKGGIARILHNTGDSLSTKKH